MDAGTLEQVLYHIHNWFIRDSFDVTDCDISGGSLPASVTEQMLDGQWYSIEGSWLNDGLHRNPDTELEDETFDGTIRLLAIPKALLNVVEEIQEYLDLTDDARKAALSAKYSSESFDGYSYSIRSDLASQNGSGGLTGWQAAFASRLNPWRKMY